MKKRLLAMLLAAVMVTALLPTAFAADDTKTSTVKVETLVEPTYEEVGGFGSDENGNTLYAAVKQNGKWGYIDQTGKMVIQPQYDYVRPFQEGVAIVAKEHFYIDTRYNWETGKDEEYTYSDGYQLYLLSADGKETALRQAYYFSYDNSYEYDDYVVYADEWDDDLGDYVEVNPIDSYWGCYGGVVFVGYPYLPDGTPILPQNVRSILFTGYSDISLNTPTMWGPCVNGVIPMRTEYYAWDEATDTYDEGAIAFYIDVNGNITRTFPHASFYVNSFDGVYSVYAPDESGLTVGYYGRWLSEGHWDDDYENWIEGEFSGGFGAMRADGTWAVSPAYSSFRYFLNGTMFTQGLLTAAKDGKYGAVNTSGQQVIPLEYDAMTSFNDDLCAVQKDGKWFYVDMYNNAYQIGTPEGGVASNIQIASHFSNDIAAVFDGQRAYCIVNTPVNGVLPAVQGTEDLALSVYFPDYEEYLKTGNPGEIQSVGKYAAIERDGKWGFLKLTFELEGTNPFDDIHIGDWQYDHVLWAVEDNITSGTSDTTFTPGRTCTDIEILTFLWRAAGKPSAAQAPITAQPANIPDFQSAVNWAYEKGMIGETFKSDAPCTRASTVSYIWQAFDSESAAGSSFTDVPAGADYAEAVDWAVANGVTAGTGDGTTFSPNTICSRGEIVTFLHRAYVPEVRV